MIKQFFINEYFSKLCTEKFFKNDEEEIIGKVKDVIQNLEEQVDYVKNPENGIDEESIELIVNETKELINEINEIYLSEDDVIGIYNHPMAGFYVLRSKKELFEELKKYYEDIKSN